MTADLDKLQFYESKAIKITFVEVYLKHNFKLKLWNTPFIVTKNTKLIARTVKLLYNQCHEELNVWEQTCQHALWREIQYRKYMKVGQVLRRENRNITRLLLNGIFKEDKAHHE